MDRGFLFGRLGRDSRNFFHIEDLLRRMRWTRDRLGLIIGLAVPGIVANFPTFEVMSFSYALCSLLWGKLFQLDKVYVHSIRVLWGLRNGRRQGSEAVVSSTSLQLITVKFVAMEDLCLFDSFFKSVWWDGHG